MRTHTILTMTLAMMYTSICSAAGEPKRPDDSILRQTFDLAAPRSRDPQSFEMETRVTHVRPGRQTRQHGRPEAPAQVHPGPGREQGRRPVHVHPVRRAVRNQPGGRGARDGGLELSVPANGHGQRREGAGLRHRSRQVREARRRQRAAAAGGQAVLRLQLLHRLPRVLQRLRRARGRGQGHPGSRSASATRSCTPPPSPKPP